MEKINLKNMFAVENLTCLKLNKNWLGIGTEGLESAISKVFKGTYLAMDVNYPLANGEYDFENPDYRPVSWEVWETLPVRSFDYSISSPYQTFRIPTVVISKNFSKIPIFHAKLSKKAIFERDDWTCQYTGRKLSKEDANIDHLIPVSRNGKNTWENMVTCDIKINSLKSNKTVEEFGMPLIKKPKKPNAQPFVIKIENKHRDWKWFVY